MHDDEIKRLLAKCSPSPWTAGLLETDLFMERELMRARITARHYVGYAVWRSDKVSSPVVCLAPACDADHRADADLMAAAPYLAQEVLDLRARVRLLEEQNKTET